MTDKKPSKEFPWHDHEKDTLIEEVNALVLKVSGLLDRDHEDIFLQLGKKLEEVNV